MKIIRTISAIVLALLVLVSSTSFMVGVHFCKGEIKNVALFTKASACEKEQNLPPCHRHKKTSCCDDETIIHKGDDLKAATTDIQLSTLTPLIVALPPVLISAIIPPSSPSIFYQYNYDPPWRSFDLTIQFHTFLI